MSVHPGGSNRANGRGAGPPKRPPALGVDRSRLNRGRRGIVARPRMRSPWLVLSLVVHSVAIGTALGLAVHAGGRQPLPPPRVEVQPTLASAPAAPPTQPLPPVEAEAPVADTQLLDVQVVEPIEPPSPQDVASEPMPRQVAAPTLQRVVPAALPQETPVEVAPDAADPQATVEAVRCVDNLPPNYPEHERRLGHEGVVVLTVRVGVDGLVAAIEVKTPSPFPGLDREAVRAVRRWRFEPAQRHGRPVTSDTDVTIEFQLRAAGR
jgi:periplasmic protein TonB